MLFRIKELPAPRREIVRRGPAAMEHEPAETHQPGPGAVALLHGVGESHSVLLELLKNPAHLVVLLIDGVSRHQGLVLRVEQKHQAHQYGDQTAVESLRILVRHGTQQGVPLALGGPVRLLKAPQQMPQGCQHLVRQGIAHHGLEAAAGLQNISQPGAVRIEKHTALAQQ